MRAPAILLASIAISAAAPEVDVTLRGSPASMERQHQVAVAGEFAFVRTPAQLGGLADEGRLVPIPGGPDYELARVSYPFAVPEVRAFLEYLAPRYRAACGEALVVTSLMRPESGQPTNAHALSVHPAGLAVDFRISQTQACRRWLEEALLALERENVLDATRETNPPHYHVAVFPKALRAHLAADGAAAGSAAVRGAGSVQRAGQEDRRAWPWAVVAALFIGAVGLIAYRMLPSRKAGVRTQPAPPEGGGAGPGAESQPRRDTPSTRSMR